MLYISSIKIVNIIGILFQNSETEERIFSKERVLKNFFDLCYTYRYFPLLRTILMRIALDGNKLKKI